METIVRTIMPDREFLGHVFKLALPIAFQQLMLSLSSCAQTGKSIKRICAPVARAASSACHSGENSANGVQALRPAAPPCCCWQ